MPRLVPNVLLWKEEGTGGFNSWRDEIELRRRANGDYVLAVRRRTIDSEPNFTAIVHRSRPFRRAVGLLAALDAWGRALDRADSDPYSAAALLRMVSRLIEWDAPLAEALLRTLAKRIAPDERLRDLLPD